MTDWIAELDRCRWDVKRFAKVFLGIDLHPGQERMARAYLARTKSKWRALYLWLMVAAGNRAGKTAGLAIIILHSCVYRMGLKPPDPNDSYDIQRWGTIPYHWWHFAIEQGPAEQVFVEIITMLGGIHPAQKRGCPWATAAGEGDAVAGARKIATATVTEGVEWTNGSKERGEYAIITLAKDLGGAIIHFRSTKAKALSAIGQNMHGLSFDEAGLETNLTYLLNEVMHARRLGTGGQFIVISTPSVATSTDFEDLWFTGDPEDPFREDRRFSMRMSSRENIGFGLDRESFEALVAGQPENWIRQNIEGEFVQAATVWFNSKSIDACFDETLPEDQDPIAAHVYGQAVDPGLKDKCWSLVFDIKRDGTAVGVAIDRIVGKQTTRGIVNLAVRVHQRYAMGGKAFIETGVDTTALGGHMFRDLLEETIPTKSVEFGGLSKVKRLLLSDLRTAMDEGRLKFPATGFWVELRKQLRNYKLIDRKIEQDLVMALAIIVKLIRQAPRPSDEEAAPFDYNATEPVETKKRMNMRQPRQASARVVNPLGHPIGWCEDCGLNH